MTRSNAHRRRPSVWTVIALVLFVVALVLWIVIRPDDADQDNRSVSPPLPIATGSVQSPEV